MTQQQSMCLMQRRFSPSKRCVFSVSLQSWGCVRVCVWYGECVLPSSHHLRRTLLSRRRRAPAGRSRAATGCYAAVLAVRVQWWTYRIASLFRGPLARSVNLFRNHCGGKFYRRHCVCVCWSTCLGKKNVAPKKDARTRHERVVGDGTVVFSCEMKHPRASASVLCSHSYRRGILVMKLVRAELRVSGLHGASQRACERLRGARIASLASIHVHGQLHVVVVHVRRHNA